MIFYGAEIFEIKLDWKEPFDFLLILLTIKTNLVQPF